MAERVLAIDVALLLPEEAAARARALNRALLELDPGGFRLDETHLPHVTLVQQGILERDLERAREVIAAAASGRHALELEALGVATPRETAHLILGGSGELASLHLALLDALEPLVAAAGAEAFLGDDEPARERDVAWVRDYRLAASRDRFNPHVTLGVGRLASPEPGSRFAASRLALCQLGRYCTCRRVLAEWRLPGKADDEA